MLFFEYKIRKMSTNRNLFCEIPMVSKRLKTSNITYFPRIKISIPIDFISNNELLRRRTDRGRTFESITPRPGFCCELNKSLLYFLVLNLTWINWNSISDREKCCIVVLLAKNIVAQSHSCSSICSTLKRPVCTWSEITACTINIIYSEIAIVSGSIVMRTCIDWFLFRVPRTESLSIRAGLSVQGSLS